MKRRHVGEGNKRHQVKNRDEITLQSSKKKNAAHDFTGVHQKKTPPIRLGERRKTTTGSLRKKNVSPCTGRRNDATTGQARSRKKRSKLVKQKGESFLGLKTTRKGGEGWELGTTKGDLDKKT